MDSDSIMIHYICRLFVPLMGSPIRLSFHFNRPSHLTSPLSLRSFLSSWCCHDFDLPSLLIAHFLLTTHYHSLALSANFRCSSLRKPPHSNCPFSAQSLPIPSDRILRLEQPPRPFQALQPEPDYDYPPIDLRFGIFIVLPESEWPIAFSCCCQ